MSKSIRLLILSGILIFSMVLVPITPVFALTYPAEINQSFTPIAIVSGGVSKLRITIYNPNGNPLTNASWSDNLTGVQPGLSIANPLNVVNTCGALVDVTNGTGGSLTPGDTSLKLNNGTVPAQVAGNPGNCYVEVDVTSTTPGNLINTIPAYGVPPAYGGVGLQATTIDGGTSVTIHNTTPASATLNVVAVQAPSLSKSFNPNTIAVGGTSKLTIIITNNDTKNPLTQTTLTDALPTGVVLANPVQSGVTPVLSGCGSANLLNAPAPGGTAVAPGDTALSLDNATIAKSSNCVITVAVTSLTQGAYTNTIPVGSGTPGASIHTREGVTNASPASDNLNVQAFSLKKYFGSDTNNTNPPTIAAGDFSMMTIIIQNVASIDYNGVGLTDTLPAATTAPVASAVDALQYELDGSQTTTGCGSTPSLSISSVVPATVNNKLTLSGADILANSSCTITVKVRANMKAPEGTYTNTIPTGAMSTTQGATNNAPASGDLKVKSLSIYKAFWLTTAPTPPFPPGPAAVTFAAGQTSHLTITISNPSPNDFTGASVSDILPTSPNSNLQYTGTPTTTCGSFLNPATVSLTGSPTRTVVLTNGTVPGGSLASPGTCTITVDVTTPANAPAANNYNNSIPAKAITTTEGGTNVSPSNTATVNVTTVSLNKAYTTGTLAYPNASLLTFTITNPVTGGALTGIAFTDTLDSRLEIVASPAPATTCNATTTPTLTATAGTQIISLSNGSMAAAPGPSAVTCTVTVYVRPKATTSSNTGIPNTISPGDLTTNEGPTNSNTVTRNLVVNAVSVAKAFTYSSFEAGGTDTLTITLTNSTGSPYTGASISDTLPASPNSNLEFTGTPTLSSSCNPGTVSLSGVPTRTVALTNGTIPAGGTCVITATVTTHSPSDPSTSYTGANANTIPVGALTTTEGPSNTTAATAPVSVYVTGAGMTATKTFTPATINIGGNSDLKLTFQAPPDVALTNFSFTDNLPSGVTVSNSSAPTSSGCGTLAGSWPPTNGATSIVVSGGTIAIGGTCTIHVWVTSNTGSGGAGIKYTNTINPTDITNGQGRSIPAAVSKDLYVQTPSTLTVSKAFYPTVVNPDGFSTLKITLTNTNAAKLINVTLDDFLPDTTTNGVVVAPTPNASTTCTETGNPAAITFPTSQNIHMANGTIPAQVGGVSGICTINVDVQGKSTNGASSATHTNNIQTTNVVATIQGTSSTMNSASLASAPLIVRNLSLEVVKGFVPQLVYGGTISKMSVTLRNPNTGAELTGLAFTDTMPSDGLTPPAMMLADPPNLDPSACGPDAVMTGTAGSNTFSFSGGYLAPGAECTLTADVTMTVNGNRTNTIPALAVTSFNGAKNQTPTQASLTNLAGASVSKSFSPGQIDAGLGNHSILTIIIRSTANVALTQLGLVDNLPAGLQVAGGTAPAATNSCGGTFSASPGDTTIQLSGGNIPTGFSFCTLTVSVTGANPGVYTNTIPPNTLTNAENTSNHEPAVATLTLTPYSLGNRVWYDTNNDGLLDNGEVGISGVRVNLYRDNGTTPGVFDSGDTFVGYQTTDASGYYRFDNLDVGSYVVVIPADNFRDIGAGDTVPGNPLAGYVSSGTSISANGTASDSFGPNPNTSQTDSDDNGVTTFNGNAVNYVSAQAVTLGPGLEPIGETDPVTNPLPGEAPDKQSNRTIDFGFYRMQLGDQIYQDINQNGTFDAGDTPLPGATVKLFASDGTTEINVGPDGILGTADDAPGGVTTAADGKYQFGGLPAGDYIVKVLPTGYPSTVDTANVADTSNPNTNADNNDNGVGILGGTVSSNIVTLTPGSLGALSKNTVNNAAGTTYNPTVDFGYITSFGKTIVNTSAAHTTGSNVAIGEVVTYEVDMTIPANTTLNNVQLVDIPQTGLAFVDCISVTLPTGVTSTKFGSGACNTSDGTIVGTSNPLIENSGGLITFDFGTVANSTASAQVVKVQYSVIVLDILANQNGGNLTNNATWTWTGGTKTTSAPLVQIVEPKMTIEKNATPTSVASGDTVTFAIDIAHATQSTADAFDVVVKDQIPAGFSFVPGSLVNTGTAALTSSNYDSATSTLRLVWNVFHRGETAHISFQAIFIGPAPVINSANVEWTSLTIDPFPTPPQLSPYNTNATARWYDPSSPAGVNGYGVSSSVTITSPFQAAGLPGTGFAPGVVTTLPPQPESLAYKNLGDLWLEIPRLKVQMPIVGILLSKDGSWDLTWLADQAGYLDGTAYPTHAGNSVLTAHVYMPNGQPGPFVNLGTLRWGDQIIVHLGGQRYVYEVRDDKVVSPQDISVFKHEELPWLTLLTCKDFDAATNTYLHRVAVRAVQIKVEPDR